MTILGCPLTDASNIAASARRLLSSESLSESLGFARVVIVFLAPWDSRRRSVPCSTSCGGSVGEIWTTTPRESRKPLADQGFSLAALVTLG